MRRSRPTHRHPGLDPGSRSAAVTIGTPDQVRGDDATKAGLEGGAGTTRSECVAAASVRTGTDWRTPSPPDYRRPSGGRGGDIPAKQATTGASHSALDRRHAHS